MSDDLGPLPTVAEQYPNGTPAQQKWALEDDNARLRALIKAKEWGATPEDPQDCECPWCGNIKTLLRYANGKPVFGTGSHAADCPAFTPEGEVR